ncbi:MAG: Tetratricopeptide repeat-containing protein [Candidatus Electronema aureum]|uniref:Tetratricopeptide repeat-containing protein n=1 Tax=Candidatus Electronema aureum TaxID=2005002 RepID=A0A521G468_9BACT|nr:MAG: Tetratricopeptide repeat-containing protein [Candidatus Electronema aureum]
MDNQFHSNGGEQNIAQGDHAIGKQVNNYGIQPEVFAQYVRELGVTDSALASFFKILEEQQVSRGDLDSKLREIAFRYKELLLRFEAVTSDDPQVKALKEQAKQAIENGEYDQADALLNQAKERDRAAVAKLKASLAEQQAALEKRQLSEAQSCVEQADLQRLQYRYEKSAQYFQEAAAALPEGYKKERAEYLGAAGNDLDNIACYAEALPLYEQSLSIRREINDRKGQAMSLNNISQIYNAQGDYGKALDYLEQSLTIRTEVGDKKGECTIMNNIAALAYDKGDYPKALKFFVQILPLRREMHDKEGEGAVLNNIGMIHDAHGDYATALQYYNQALAIAREIKDKRLESTCLNNISAVYDVQENYDAAWEYAKQSLGITRQIGDRIGEGVTLNNIASICYAKGDYFATLKQYEQALAIAQEIGDKDGEAVTSENIGWFYAEQGELVKAEPYLSRAVELGTQLEHPDLELWREILKAVRTKLREQGTVNAASTVKRS